MHLVFSCNCRMAPPVAVENRAQHRCGLRGEEAAGMREDQTVLVLLGLEALDLCMK